MNDRNQGASTPPARESSQGNGAPIIDEQLRGLARRLMSQDYSQQSKIRESLRLRLAGHVAGAGQPFPRPNLAAAMASILLVFFLAFTWSESSMTGGQERPTRLMTANASNPIYADFKTAASTTTTTLTQVKSERAQVTPGAVASSSGIQARPQPALAPAPRPPSQ